MPKLKEILYQGIERQKKNKEARRKKMESMSLDNLESTTAYLTIEQFEQIKETYTKIKISMAEFKFAVHMLDMKVQTLLLHPLIKKEEEQRKEKQSKFLEKQDAQMSDN